MASSNSRRYLFFKKLIRLKIYLHITMYSVLIWKAPAIPAIIFDPLICHASKISITTNAVAGYGRSDMIFFSQVDNCRRWQVKENPSLPDSFSWVFEGEYRKPKRQARFRPASGYWGRGFLSFCAPPTSTYFFCKSTIMVWNVFSSQGDPNPPTRYPRAGECRGEAHGRHDYPPNNLPDIFGAW